MKKTLGILATFIVLSAGVQAEEIVVCPAEGNGCDYTSIQEAVNKAKDGDVIRIKRGIYNEHDIVIKNKCIDVKGEDPNSTIINAEGLGNGIRVVYQDKSCDFTLSSLQIRSSSTENGGGIYVYHHDYGGTSNVKLINLVLIGNSATKQGGGIYVYNDWGSLKVMVENSNISKNTASEAGGGIYQSGSELIIKDSRIEGNTASGGGGIASSGTLKISSSVINENISSGSGGGLLVGGEATVIKSWVVKNISSYEGGGIDTYDDKDTNLNIYSSVIAFNESGTKGGGLALGSENPPCCARNKYGVIIKSSTIYYNEAKGDSGNGIFLFTSHGDLPVNFQLFDSVIFNKSSDIAFDKDSDSNVYGSFILKHNRFSTDLDLPENINIHQEDCSFIGSPLFVNPERLDFSLYAESPLIDAGGSATDYFEDIAGSLRIGSPDIGACEYPSKCKLDALEPSVPSLEIPFASANFTQIITNVSFSAGWNLAGIPSFEEKTITDIFGDNLSNVYTLWKWNRNAEKWELYTSDEQIKNYVRSFPVPIKLIDETSKIKPGEGFWVKADSPFNLKFKGYKSVK